MMNIHELRYRILKEYYDSFFIDDEPLRFATILDLFKKINLLPRFILANTIYLLVYKYIVKEGNEYRISARGIRFIEDITEGDIDYALFFEDSIPSYKDDQVKMLADVFEKFNEMLRENPNELPFSSLEQVNSSVKPKQSNRKGRL